MAPAADTPDEAGAEEATGAGEDGFEADEGSALAGAEVATGAVPEPVAKTPGTAEPEEAGALEAGLFGLAGEPAEEPADELLDEAPPSET